MFFPTVSTAWVSLTWAQDVVLCPLGLLGADPDPNSRFTSCVMKSKRSCFLPPGPMNSNHLRMTAIAVSNVQEVVAGVSHFFVHH